MDFSINIDFRLLRRQKLALVKLAMEKKDKNLDGIICMLDSIQDQAAERLGEKAVFGRDFQISNKESKSA